MNKWVSFEFSDQILRKMAAKLEKNCGLIDKRLIFLILIFEQKNSSKRPQIL
jgi:hypothetical protein